jgi:hypothetical protein
MLKGLQITALALTLASLLVGISTEIANAKQSTGYTVDSGDTPSDKRCTRKPCPVTNSGGNTPGSHRGVPASIVITRPELNNVTNEVAIKKLKALKSTGQATSDDYLLLGYFYSLEKKYDLSEANYLTALKLATDDARKDIIKQQLEKLPASTPQLIPVGN